MVKKMCDLMSKKELEEISRLDLWGIALREEPNVCVQTSLLAAKVYAEKYVKGTGRESYYQELTDIVIDSIDDSGNWKTTDKKKLSKVLEFAGLMYVE